MFAKDSAKDAKIGSAEVTTFPAAAAPRGNGATAQSIISRDLKIKGDLICKGDIQIDGQVEGDVQSQSITIGEGADVSGSISSDTVRVSGSVNGTIKGQSVILAKTAKLIGDIVHQTLMVEPGAHFEGQCRRMDAAKS